MVLLLLLNVINKSINQSINFSLRQKLVCDDVSSHIVVLQIQDQEAKSQFFNNLPSVLELFPPSFSKLKILPLLINAFEFGNAGSTVLTPLFKVCLFCWVIDDWFWLLLTVQLPTSVLPCSHYSPSSLLFHIDCSIIIIVMMCLICLNIFYNT